MLDRLLEARMTPALCISQKLGDVVNRIDSDAERLLEKDAGNVESTEQVNAARCEFIRIVRVFEKRLLKRLETNETKKLEDSSETLYHESFEALKERVEKFQSTSVDKENDINDLEDLYGQLVLELEEMTNNEESSVFDNQSMFYVSSTNTVRESFGNLLHIKGVTLSEGQIDFLR